MGSSNHWILRPRNLGIVVFVYTLAAGLFVQTILLPRLLPEMHAGHGLITGVDGRIFHRAALDLSQRIEQYGWSAWTPKPDGQFVAGMAAIFYTLIYPEPWSVLPLNALLNAIACLSLYGTLVRLTRDRGLSLLAAVPFLLFPASLLWNTQFHNENYAVPGVMLICFGWASLLRAEPDGVRASRSELAAGVATIALGSLLLGAVRDVVFKAIVLLCSGAAAGLLILWAWRRVGLEAYARRAAVLVAACASMWLCLELLTPEARPTQVTRAESPAAESGGGASTTDRRRDWVATRWLPRRVDSAFSAMARARRQTVRLGEPGDSGIDLQVRPQNAMEVLAYAPRALQIAALAPFPSMWFTEGTKASGTAMRAVSAFEMMAIYVALLGLPIFMWFQRREPAAWLLLLMCTVMLTVYGLMVANVGALYRFRYPFLMLLVAYGAAGWLQAAGRARRSRAQGSA